jgi:hypothetical protein
VNVSFRFHTITPSPILPSGSGVLEAFPPCGRTLPALPMIGLPLGEIGGAVKTALEGHTAVEIFLAGWVTERVNSRA